VILAGGRSLPHRKSWMDERCSSTGERFGTGEVVLHCHHLVDVGKDFIDEPLPAGRAGFCRVDIGWGRRLS